MKILEVKNLCKHYEKFDLKNVSFEIKPGKIIGFIGRNGAGTARRAALAGKRRNPAGYPRRREHGADLRGRSG